MKKIIVLIIMLVFSHVSFSEALKVVYHVNESEKVQLVISTINQLLTTNTETDIKIVVHSGAVKRLAKTDEISKDFQSLVNRGVYVGVCSISMLEKEIMPSLVIEGVKFITKGGIQKILEFQKQGYLYIKI